MNPAMLIELVDSGEVSEARLDVSARRLLREKFILGLFDNRYVDIEHARQTVGAAEFTAAGEAAQRASVTLLANGERNGAPLLPLPAGQKLYLEGVPADIASRYGTVVDTPDEADVAILRIAAPFEQRATVFENLFHAGSLDFPQDTVDHVREIAATLPTIVDVFLDRPAILTPIAAVAGALTGNWGTSAEALMDVLTGRAEPRGKLPFDLPSSMAAVENSRSDVPFDTADPLFRFGFGLRYS